jgi:hypothetical protein
MSEHPSVETLFRQASMTADTYFNEAIHAIDRRFSEGYAEEHPELIGAFMQTAAFDFLAGLIGARIIQAAELIESRLNDIDTAISGIDFRS